MQLQPALKRKIIAYIVQQGCLLVFRHTQFPEAGIQVPAGSVEKGESLDDAVVREAGEETGLSGLRIAEYLGSDDWVWQQKNTILERHFYRLEVDQPLPDRWLSYEWNPSDGSPAPIEFECFWMPLDQVLNQGLAGNQHAMLHKLR